MTLTATSGSGSNSRSCLKQKCLQKLVEQIDRELPCTVPSGYAGVKMTRGGGDLPYPEAGTWRSWCVRDKL